MPLKPYTAAVLTIHPGLGLAQLGLIHKYGQQSETKMPSAQLDMKEKSDLKLREDWVPSEWLHVFGPPWIWL